MARHIRQYAQRHTDDGGVAGTHAIHTVVEVGSVGDSGHHEDGHQHEENPTSCLLVFAETGGELLIVEVVVLQEGDGRLQALHRLTLMLHHHFLPLVLLERDILAHHRIGTEIEHQAHNQADAHLAHNLVLALQSLLVSAENLDVVVHETEETQPQGSGNHEDEVDIAHSAQEQHGHQDGHHDDDAAHGGHTLLLHTEGVDGGVTLHLRDIPAVHILDELLSKPRRDDQREDEGQQRPERDIGPDM